MLLTGSKQQGRVRPGYSKLCTVRDRTYGGEERDEDKLSIGWVV